MADASKWSRIARAANWTAAHWLLLGGLLGYGIITWSRIFGRCIHDDAFISFRYARSLARGQGLVMNPGEHVEGFTNLLWTVVWSPVIAAGGDPAKWAQLAGAVLLLGLVVAVFLFTERRLGGGWYALVAPAMLVFNPAFTMDSLSGLETMLFAVLVFATYASFLEERRGGIVRCGGWAAWCAAATVVRPEGMLIFALLAAYLFVGIVRREPAHPLRGAVLVYAILVAPLWVWRLAYYGSFFPNTFYTKVGYTAAQLVRGWRYMVHSVGWTLTPAVLFVAALFTVLAMLRPLRGRAVPTSVSRTRLFAGRSQDESLAVAFLLWIGYFVYIVLVGGDYEPTARFYAPVLALLALLFQEGLRTFALFFEGTPATIRAGVAVLTLAGGAACIAQSEHRLQAVLRVRGWPERRHRHDEQLRAVGRWLHDNTPPSSVIAVSSIGALSYYADRPIIDMMGLTDRHIGRLTVETMGKGPAGHEKGDGAYVLSRHPDVVLFDKGHLFPQEVDLEEVLAGARGISELEIAASGDFRRDYELRRAVTIAGILHYFERRP